MAIENCSDCKGTGKFNSDRDYACPNCGGSGTLLLPDPPPTQEPTVQLPGCGWYLRHNPEGGGLLLCVPRGISCEGHTQVLSSHTTNTPDMVTVQVVVQELAANIEKQVDAFVKLMQALGQDWTLKEHIGLLFLHGLVKKVADAAERKEFP